jgi:hypothetical protein
MARLVSVANIRYEHVSWDVDAFVINLEKTKRSGREKMCMPTFIIQKYTQF